MSLTKEQKGKIAELYPYYTQQEIADKLKLSLNQVKYALQLVSARKRIKKPKPFPKLEVGERYRFSKGSKVRCGTIEKDYDQFYLVKFDSYRECIHKASLLSEINFCQIGGRKGRC